MVAVCVVVNTLFPVVCAVEKVAATSTANGADATHSGTYRVVLRHEDGRIDELIPDPELTGRLCAAHGTDLRELAGKPWRAILSNLPTV